MLIRTNSSLQKELLLQRATAGASEGIPHCAAALSFRQQCSSLASCLVPMYSQPGRQHRARAGAGSQTEQCWGRKVEAVVMGLWESALCLLVALSARRFTVPLLADLGFLFGGF